MNFQVTGIAHVARSNSRRDSEVKGIVTPTPWADRVFPSRERLRFVPSLSGQRSIVLLDQLTILRRDSGGGAQSRTLLALLAELPPEGELEFLETVDQVVLEAIKAPGIAEGP